MNPEGQSLDAPSVPASSPETTHGELIVAPATEPATAEPQIDGIAADPYPVSAPEPEPAPEPELQPHVSSFAELEPAPRPDLETREPESTPPPPPAPLAPSMKNTPKKMTPKSADAPLPEAGPEESGRVRRERKKVEVFQAETKTEEEPVMMEGKGTKLRDIPNVTFKMSKITGKDELMESFHNVLYRRKGMANTRKKAILDFCGFAFVADQEEKELGARRVSLSKWKLDLIHRLMDTLDLPRGSGDKSAKIDKLIDFLRKPHQASDVDLASKEADKKEKARRKREREAAKREKTKRKREQAKAKKEKEAAKKRKKSSSGNDASDKKAKRDEEEDDDVESDGMEESEESEDEPVSDVDHEEAATGVRKEKHEKESTPRKVEKPKPAAEAPPSGDPASRIPSTQLKSDLEALLREKTDEELTEMTAKIILNALKEQYGFEVRSRKSELKEFAQDYIDSRLEGSAAAAAAADP